MPKDGRKMKWLILLFIIAGLSTNCSHTETPHIEEASTKTSSTEETAKSPRGDQLNTYTLDLWSMEERRNLGYFLASLVSEEDTQTLQSSYTDYTRYEKLDCRNHLNAFIAISQDSGYRIVSSPSPSYILIRAIQSSEKGSPDIRHFALWKSTDKRFQALPKDFIAGRCLLYGQKMDAAIF